MTGEQAKSEIEQLVDVIAALRNPKTGCPWDLKQSHKSLLKYLVEESYEYIQAVEEEDFQKMEEEMGDVLLQVVLHAQLASEEKKFDFESVAKKIKNKMIRRHPHVFANPEGRPFSEKEIKENWQSIKGEEKAEQKESPSKFDPAIVNFPALMGAHKIGKKSALIDFDWDSADEVFEKVEEEWGEFKEEWNKKSSKMEEELGDLFFSLAQLARHLDMDPEEVLRKSNKKFLHRFKRLEDCVKQDGKEYGELTRQDKESYWKRIKTHEN